MTKVLLQDDAVVDIKSLAPDDRKRVLRFLSTISDPNTGLDFLRSRSSIVDQASRLFISRIGKIRLIWTFTGESTLNTDPTGVPSTSIVILAAVPKTEDNQRWPLAILQLAANRLRSVVGVPQQRYAQAY